MNYMVIGRMSNPDYISGVGLGITFSFITWFSIAMGLAGGIETLSSQAFGNKSYYLAGWYYNRAQVILTAIFIPQSILLYFATDILVAIGQPQEAAIFAGNYIRVIIPGIWAYCQTELLRRFLSSQGEFQLMFKIQLITTVLHALWVYLFVFWVDIGMDGIAVATCITYILNFVIGTVYITLNKSVVKEGSWHWINRDSFRGIIEYLRYGIPSMLMVMIDNWSFEVLLFMSGYVGVIELGANIIIYNIEALIYLIAYGASITSSSLVGNSLGARHPHKAKVYTNMGILFSLICSGIIVLILIFKGREVMMIFTTHAGILNCSYQLIYILLLLTVSDYLSSVLSGVIRAMGYQIAASIILGIYSTWIIQIK